MADWIDRFCLTADDAFMSRAEVFSCVQQAQEEHVDKRDLFAQIKLNGVTLEEHAERVSLSQLYAVTSAIAASSSEGFDLRVAQRMHLTSYGIAGYALLSSSTLREALNTAEAYSPLLNLKFHLVVRMECDLGCIGLYQRYTMDGDMLAQSLRFELVKLKTLLDDVVCGSISVRELACGPQFNEVLSDLPTVMGVQAHIGINMPEGALAEIRIDASRLDTTLAQSNATTYQSCKKVCDALMSEFAEQYDLARQVKDALRKSICNPPTQSEIASSLCLSQRTLRRRLEALKTSYNLLLDEVRKDMAISYLTTTRYKTEAIANLLGYSEAANFRHAFKRWTGMSPRNYADDLVRINETVHCEPSRRAGYPTLTLHESKARVQDGAYHASVEAWSCSA